MNSKVIDISKSSLVGLKAELLKKQEEVKKLKQLQQGYNKHDKPPKKLQSRKFNKKTDCTEKEIIPEDILDNESELKKSREVLEKKAQLYHKLKETHSSDSSKYLIDFDLKSKIYQEDDYSENKDSEVEQQCPEEEDYCSDANSDPENDWVDFVDTLGRSRRCLRKDLPEMEAKDRKLKASLQPPSPPPVPEISPDLLSWDMQREAMRKKWEEQEAKLRDKKDIYYQDILFDEARTHGVGYFEFSVEENERLKQQEALKNLRNETIEQQTAAVGLRLRRQQQLQARLVAARARRRERLGLPPEEPDAQEPVVDVTDDHEEQKPDENIEDLEQTIKKIAPTRPWDVGKSSFENVMSQEEWVEKKREERVPEFAPPTHLIKQPENYCKPENNVSFSTSNKFKQQNKNNKAKSAVVNAKNEKSCSINLVRTKSRPFKNDQAAFQSESTCVELSDQTSTLSRENKSDEAVDDSLKKTSKQIDELLSRAKEKCFEIPSVKTQTQMENISSEQCMNEECPRLSVNEWEQSSKTNLRRNACDGGDQQPKNVHIYKNIDGNDGVVNDNSQSGFIRYRNTKLFANQNEEQAHEQTLDNFDTNSENSLPTSTKLSKRKWAEIAPPPSMSYYLPSRSHHKEDSRSKIDLEDSLSAGLEYLKNRSEEKNKKRTKGLLDIV